jgi:alkylation response protein AidB-like acyl-CoA dehydrogenase
MTKVPKITSPDDEALDLLCRRLADGAAALDAKSNWPGEQLALCGRYGVFEWFLPTGYGGQGWCERDIIRGYLRLSASCLTTTFVITQLTGASRRIAGSDREELKSNLLSRLALGEQLATVGISHLTTSRRHLGRPVLHAQETSTGFILSGFSPWVTGAKHADFVVTGATMDDEKQILVVLPTDAPGVTVPSPIPLVGLAGSHTGEVRLDNVRLGREWLLDGPVERVMERGVGAGTGGLQTSTLAVGLASAAVDFLQDESARRADLAAPVDQLELELAATREDLLALADGEPVCTTELIRVRANNIALRATQAALAAAKGTGYVVGHPAGRWCREALFFLVWSCPQPVMAAHLCELAGISD